MSRKKNMTQSIIKKWREQGAFIRFMDNDITNCSYTNLKMVDLYEALENIDTWTVDWDMELTEKEIELVKNAEWRAGLFKTK